MNDANFDVKMKVRILQMLISPILFEAFSGTNTNEQDQLIDSEIIKIIMTDGLGACDDRTGKSGSSDSLYQKDISSVVATSESVMASEGADGLDTAVTASVGSGVKGNTALRINTSSFPAYLKIKRRRCLSIWELKAQLALQSLGVSQAYVCTSF